MVELRKRKTPPPAPVRPAKKKAAPKADKTNKSAVGKAKAAVTEKIEAVKEAVTGGAAANGEAPAPAPAAGAPKAGDSIELASFGGDIETHEGTKTTLAKLVDQSKSGVVLFAYPKASTPGCTRQACAVRDSYAPLTATGFDIYGLSNDSAKSNTSFKTKQTLPYPLLCDPSRNLISAIGLKAAKGTTTRGLFIVNKQGKVLAAQPVGPDATVEAIRKIVEAGEGGPAGEAVKEQEDAELAKTASEVADTAAKIDGDKA